MTESTTSQGFRWDITVFIGFIQCRLSSSQWVAESIGIGWRFQSESSGGLRRNRQRAKSKRISSYLSEKKDESGSCVLLDSEGVILTAYDTRFRLINIVYNLERFLIVY